MLAELTLRWTQPAGKAQSTTARQLLDSLGKGRPPIVYLVCFPALTLNHSILLFAGRRMGSEIQFDGFDPNDPSQPATLQFREGTGFVFPRTRYFAGGKVNVYEVYRNWLY